MWHVGCVFRLSFSESAYTDYAQSREVAYTQHQATKCYRVTRTHLPAFACGALVSLAEGKGFEPLSPCDAVTKPHDMDILTPLVKMQVVNWLFLQSPYWRYIQ